MFDTIFKTKMCLFKFFSFIIDFEIILLVNLICFSG